MRPAGRGPLESLYFTYPRFAASAPSAQTSRTSVAIAGAGPIGMTAALTLARYGVASVVLDRKDTFNDGSRAICIARSSMQILEQIGAVDPFLAKALGWRHGTSYYRGQPILRLEMPHSAHEKYLPMYNLQQQYIEQYLHDAVAACRLIDMRWQSEVTGVSQDANGAQLTVSTTHGPYSLQADYVLAADGARSPIRSMLGLRLRGDNYEGRYVIADIRMVHDYPTERRAFFGSTAVPGGTVLIHKQPDDIWRVDWQLGDGETEADAISEASIRQRVGAILTEIGHHGPWELEWWSIYSANTLCLDEYKHSRVIFIGDSAHIVPIFGVRGLNNGIADAFNAGWKLAYVLGGAAEARLLDSYSPERRGATLDVFANASKSTRFMTPPSRGWALMREAALSLAVSQPFARPFADPRQMQPYTYADGPLTAVDSDGPAFGHGPKPGAACPNARLPDGRFLLDLAGAGFTGLHFVAPGSSDTLPALSAQLKMYDRQFKLLTIACDGEIASLYGAAAGDFYLLRPDLHVAGRWRHTRPDQIAAALANCLGKIGP